MLTFELDAETLWLAGSLERRERIGLLSQGTYGARVGAPLILHTLRRYELKATSLSPAGLPSITRMSLPRSSIKGTRSATMANFTSRSRGFPVKRSERYWSEESRRSAGSLGSSHAATARRPGNSRPERSSFSRNTVSDTHRI